MKNQLCKTKRLYLLATEHLLSGLPPPYNILLRTRRLEVCGWSTDLNADNQLDIWRRIPDRLDSLYKAQLHRIHQFIILRVSGTSNINVPCYIWRTFHY